MHPLRTLLVSLLTVIVGCAGLGVRPQEYSRTLQSPFDEVWNATIKMFEDRKVELKVVDKGQGKIITHWLYRESEKPMGMLERDYWKERHRLTLRLEGKDGTTEISTYAIVEEKRPGGTQAYRWTGILSPGDLETEVLDAIEVAVAATVEKEDE